MRYIHTLRFASRVWKQLLSRSRRKPKPESVVVKYVNGWNQLPTELVDEILRYLWDDLPTLKACALTCKILYGSARPLIGSWLYLSPVQKRNSNARSMKSLLNRSKKGLDSLARLAEIDRRGCLPHTRHLVLKMDELSLLPHCLRPYTPYFHSIGKLQTLVVDGLDVTAFMPVFHSCLGMFTTSLRSLDIRHIWDSDRQLLWFISQFPLLEDLSIRSCYALYFFLGPAPPLIRTAPPFRGNLNLSLIMDSQSLCEALAQFPGGLNFTSLELKGCGKPGAIISACQHSLKSISYTWTTALIAGRALDLKDSSMLEKFEFRTDPVNLSSTPGWLYRTLWKITSTVFREFTISVSNCSTVADLSAAMDGDDWRTVDAYLFVWSKFQPSFKVIFRVGFEGDEGDTMREFIRRRFLLVSKKKIMTVELVRNLEVSTVM